VTHPICPLNMLAVLDMKRFWVMVGVAPLQYDQKMAPPCSSSAPPSRACRHTVLPEKAAQCSAVQLHCRSRAPSTDISVLNVPMPHRNLCMVLLEQVGCNHGLAAAVR
jgi:hypothetical protein